MAIYINRALKSPFFRLQPIKIKEVSFLCDIHVLWVRKPKRICIVTIGRIHGFVDFGVCKHYSRYYAFYYTDVFLRYCNFLSCLLWGVSRYVHWHFVVSVHTGDVFSLTNYFLNTTIIMSNKNIPMYLKWEKLNENQDLRVRYTYIRIFI